MTEPTLDPDSEDGSTQPTDSHPKPPSTKGATLRIRLHPGREKAVLDHGHPWLFSGAVAAADGPDEAPLAHVFAHDGRDLGLGFYSRSSQIRVRLLGRGVSAVDRAFFARRLAEAAALRDAVLPPETDGHRVLNAEGDGVPGWIVDRFGSTLVSQITSAGLEALRTEAYAALTEAFPGCAVLQANQVPARRSEGLSQEDEVMVGEAPPEVSFQESGLTFLAELAGGQKTGFYCDQRENRRLAESLAAGRSMLDLFAHAGAFGVYGCRGGARRVVHVESSARLIEQGRRIYRLNDLAGSGSGGERAEWHEANVFEWLRQAPTARTSTSSSPSGTSGRFESAGGGFDLVVVDPPPLVARRSDLDKGARAYKDVNRLALRRTAPGGYFLTFSCSAAVDTRLFRQILFSASREAQVRLQLLRPLAAAPDHPVAVTHPEGEYLGGWLCRVVE